MLPRDLLSHALGFPLFSLHDAVAIASVSTAFREAEALADLHLLVDERRRPPHYWDFVFQWLSIFCRNSKGLYLQTSNPDHCKIAQLIKALPRLSSISISKCFSVQGNILLRHLCALTPVALSCLMLQDLPLLHLTANIPPSLSGLVSLGLTNCNMEALLPAANQGGGALPQAGRSFIEKLTSAIVSPSGELPQLRYLFLGGSFFSAPPHEVGALAALRPSPSSSCHHSPPQKQQQQQQQKKKKKRRLLKVLEVTFLSEDAVAYLAKLLHLDDTASNEDLLGQHCPRCSILRLDTSPVAELASALDNTNIGTNTTTPPTPPTTSTTTPTTTAAAAAAAKAEVAAPLPRAAATATTEARDKQACSPLILAARSNDCARVAWLLSKGARVTGVRDVHGATALYRAAEKGGCKLNRCKASSAPSASVVGAPSAASAAVAAASNHSNGSGGASLGSSGRGHQHTNSALSSGARFVSVCGQLLAAGADPVAEVNHRGECAVFISALKGHAGTLAELLAVAVKRKKKTRKKDHKESATSTASRGTSTCSTAGTVNTNNAVSDGTQRRAAVGEGAGGAPVGRVTEIGGTAKQTAKLSGRVAPAQKMLNAEADPWVPGGGGSGAGLTAAATYFAATNERQQQRAVLSGGVGGVSRKSLGVITAPPRSRNNDDDNDDDDDGDAGGDDLTAATSDADGFSPLHCAAIRRCAETLEVLLAATLEPEETTADEVGEVGDGVGQGERGVKQGPTFRPQTTACWAFDVDARNKYEQTALHLAARPQQHFRSQVSSPHSTEPLPNNVDDGSYALGTAAANKHGSTNKSQISLDHQLGSDGVAFSAGASSSSYRLVELLLSRGASVNARDDTGATPLDYALKAQQQHCTAGGGAASKWQCGSGGASTSASAVEALLRSHGGRTNRPTGVPTKGGSQKGNGKGKGGYYKHTPKRRHGTLC